MDLEWYVYAGIPVGLGIVNAIRERMGITIDPAGLKKAGDEGAEALWATGTVRGFSHVREARHDAQDSYVARIVGPPVRRAFAIGAAIGLGIDAIVYVATHPETFNQGAMDLNLVKAYVVDAMHNVQASAQALKYNATNVLHQYAMKA